MGLKKILTAGLASAVLLSGAAATDKGNESMEIRKSPYSFSMIVKSQSKGQYVTGEEKDIHRNLTYWTNGKCSNNHYDGEHFAQELRMVNPARGLYSTKVLEFHDFDCDGRVDLLRRHNLLGSWKAYRSELDEESSVQERFRFMKANHDMSRMKMHLERKHLLGRHLRDWLDKNIRD